MTDMIEVALFFYSQEVFLIELLLLHFHIYFSCPDEDINISYILFFDKLSIPSITANSIDRTFEGLFFTKVLCTMFNRLDV